MEKELKELVFLETHCRHGEARHGSALENEYNIISLFSFHHQHHYIKSAYTNLLQNNSTQMTVDLLATDAWLLIKKASCPRNPLNKPAAVIYTERLSSVINGCLRETTCRHYISDLGFLDK
jgi:hypothetical protein